MDLKGELRGMNRVDRSPEAVAARVSEALRLGREAPAGTLAKGVRMDGAAVLDRIGQVSELRRLALALRSGAVRRRAPD